MANIISGEAKYSIMGMSAEEYPELPSVTGGLPVNIPQAVKIFNQPFELTGTQGKFAVTVKVSGSGVRAQLGAVTHGLSRALVKFDESFRALLKEESMLTRDSRMKESRKPGRGGKARRKRQSPRR
jgi:ribosomal protein S9